MRNLDHSFLKRIPIAHRGYHTEDMPENTILSAQNAIDHGYAIELDVSTTKDEQIIVFHDVYAKRCLGLEGRVCKYTYDEIKDIDYLGKKGVHVSLLKDFLEFVDGRTPLLIELKPSFGFKHFVKDVVALLREYKGEFAVQSFSPFTLMELKKIAPEMLRGQLVTKDLSEMPIDNFHDRLNYWIVWLFGFTSLIWFSNPDFFNIDIRCYSKYQKRYAVRNVLTFVVTNEEEYNRAMRCTDNVVFENMEITQSEHEQVREEMLAEAETDDEA
jgi:glycerophosphoryl diester phosphodiesterase